MQFFGIFDEWVGQSVGWDWPQTPPSPLGGCLSNGLHSPLLLQGYCCPCPVSLCSLVAHKADIIAALHAQVHELRTRLVIPCEDLDTSTDSRTSRSQGTLTNSPYSCGTPPHDASRRPLAKAARELHLGAYEASPPRHSHAVPKSPVPKSPVPKSPLQGPSAERDGLQTLGRAGSFAGLCQCIRFRCVWSGPADAHN